MKHNFTAIYHPEANGSAERANGSIKAMLNTMVNEQGTDWDRWLPYVVFAYNATPHTITGYSPFYLNHGREPRLPVDNKHDRKVIFTVEEVEDDARLLVERWHQAKHMAFQRLQKAGDALEKQTATRVLPIFTSGDRVWYHEPVRPSNTPKGLWMPWIGPYQVV